MTNQTAMALGTRSTSAPSRPAASTRSPKRKREHEASSLQRQVAQKLQLCADVSDSVASVRRCLHHQMQRYKAHKARTKQLSRLRVAVEQMTHFQALFGAEMDGESAGTPQVMSLRKRCDKLLFKMSNRKKPLALRTHKVVKRLPRLMKKATSIVVDRRRLIQEQHELPPRHQWVPMILWKMYEDVVDVVPKEGKKKPLKAAMHEVMKTLKETNPFFYLQVLYQPPPPHLDRRWEIGASEKLTAISATMTPFFRNLRRRSFALANTKDPSVRIRYGWNKLRVTLAFARRAARHFHFLILHLYAVAMECAAPNVNAGIISEKAASGILSEDAELRTRLRLSRNSATSEDYLLKESYEWTPELLAYLDEWRFHRDNGRVRHGFDWRERHQDFLPLFPLEERPRRHSGRIPRVDVLAQIGYLFRDVDRTWQKSRLGTSRFQSMSIKEIGVFEKKIKGSLGAVVNLVYKMMLARWMDRRKRSAEWWNSLDLCERETLHAESEMVDLPDDFLADYGEESQDEACEVPPIATAELTEDLQDATDAESVEQKEIPRTRVDLPARGAFRNPTTVNFRDDVAHASTAKVVILKVPAPSGHVSPKPLARQQPIRLREIYAWSDEEITKFGRETERIAEVRAAMLGLCDGLQWPKASLETASKPDARPDFGEHIRDDWRVACISSQLCALANNAVAFAEEAAMHDAATALTTKPSLRLTEDKSAPLQDNSSQTASQAASEDPTVEEMQESVRDANHNVAELLSLYDGQHSTEWCDTILSTGLATVELLRLTQQLYGRAG
ncbi:hypothetical protein PHYPSEUDO_012916 [Phytophthora pseudosyringae]|uniref:Uncharacterized protein n=1 Tax=Phytophthora pseudosyringae TaxID=221518 RepID=A0A8T1W6E7_9STRA|nr:hypothetical protein PHYPSEUDO_012916 [Phytophthora pseudosyringae]